MKPNRIFFHRSVLGGFVLFLLIYLYLFAGESFFNAIKPLVIGLSIAYLLNILIRFFEKHDILYKKGILKSKGLHHVLATISALIILGIALFFIAGYVAPQATACAITLLDKVPNGIRIFLSFPFLKRLISPETMETLQSIDWSNWINHVINLVNSDDLVRGMTSATTSAISMIGTAMLGIMFAIYFLAGRSKIHAQLTRACKALLPDDREKRFFHYTGILNEVFHDYIVCQALQALMIGVASTVILMVFRFPYGSMIGALNGICALIPILGGYIGALLGALMILADSPQMAFAFLIVIVVIQNVVGILIFPRLASRSMGLPAVWSLAAVTVGGGMGGIGGIIVGVPIAAFFYRCLGDYVKSREDNRTKAKSLQVQSEGSGDVSEDLAPIPQEGGEKDP